MSEKIIIECEIRSMLIMKDTLEQMGFNYKELDDHRVQISRSYHSITIDSNTGSISCDSANKREVDKITQEYMLNFFKDKAIKEGNKFREERMANGEVELHILRS
jgi:hypothetical protein